MLDERRKCAEAFCMQRALAPGHDCYVADKQHLNQSVTVTEDNKICTETPERSYQLGTTKLLKQVLPHVILTPVRSKVSTPRGLMFDNDTESKDAWSVSMATPQSDQQVDSVELVDTVTSSTSGDESCSSLSNVEYSSSSRAGSNDVKGEVISQRVVVKQETEDEHCHRTPLTLVARKLFTKSEPNTFATSHSAPSSSPDLILSSQDASDNSQETIKSIDAPVSQSSPTCSEDMFDSTHSDITLSHVMSSTPVIERRKDDGLVAINTKEMMAVTDKLVDNNCDHVENSDTSSHKLDTEVHAHTGDVKLTDSPDSKPVTTNEKCKADTSCSKGVNYDNSDLMDELFANHFTNLTQLATEQLLEEEHKLIHSNQVANQTDSGCGDDEIHNDVMDHVISKNESVTPIPTANGFHHFTVANTAKPVSSSDKVPLRKSSKPFKAPRMAKEVGEDERNKLMEEYCKKFPSLNDNKRTSCDNGGASRTDTVIACGFASAGSGKKFTVSAAALQRAVRLVEDCTNDLFTEQHNTGSHGNTAVNEMLCHVEEDTKMVDTQKSLNQMSIPEGEEEAKETLLSKEEVGESSECGKEERSHDTTKGSHELVDNYGLDNIDMEQFSAFTQMPGYMRAGRSTDDMVDDDYQLSTAPVQQISDEIWTPAGQPSSVTPVQKEHVSSYITPGGSFNPCPSGRSVYNNNTTPCRQSADDEELKKMFSTQVVKQFLDFNSSNEDNDDTTVKVAENENSASPAHNDKILPCVTSCDTDNHIHKTCSVTENNCTRNGSPDDTSSPAHHDSKPPTSLPKSAVFGGFSTASGKSVTISDDAISKVKQLLDDACGDTISGRALRDHQCIADDVCGHSPSTVQQLFTDDKMADGDSVVTGNHTADDKSSNNTDIAVDDSHNKVISLIEPSHNAAVVLSAHGSCDPSPDTTVVMEATPVNKINYTKRISSMKRRRRDPLFTTPEAVLSDRAHPKRMCFTPMITNSNSVTRSTDDVAMATSKQAPKFMTPFKAHRMSSTPQHKSVVTPVQPVWRGSWKKLGMSTTTVPFHYSSSSSSNNNKSVNDSGIGSSLPDHPTTPAPATSATAVEEQEGIDKQFEVTDTQMESFFATQGSVSPILNHRDCGGVVRPQSGTLSMMRSTSAQRVSITSMTGCVRPGRYSRHQLISLGVHPAVLDVTAATAVNFQFDVRHYFSQSVLQKKTVTIGDGVVLKLEPHSDHMTMEQLNKAFLCSPGVDGELISTEWFANHYRWIVWKLASLEVSFPHSFAGRWLTPHWLLLHMKYRYDQEIDLAHRSCIKKILERDDNPTKTMVLVITEICSFDDNAIDNEDDIKDTSRPTLKMSDGWYSVGVVMDTPLKHVLSTNQITVGCKLYISGAKLLGSCDPCPPLECPDSVMLKIDANSTRRAHWNAKLGFQPCPAPFPVPMSSLFVDGGLVGCVHVTIVRTYPLLHMERTSDGNCVFRNQRKEEMVAKEYDTRRQQCLEDISLQVREEFEKELNQKNRRQCYRRRRSISHAQISKLTDGQKIDEALSNVPDPVEFEQHLTVTQKALLDSYRYGVLEQQRRELEQRIEMAIKESEDKLPPLRNVVPLLKVRVVGHPSRLTEWTDNSEFQSCILTVWRPTDDVVCLLQEGVSVKLYHVMASSPHRHSSDYIQLATNRGTRFERLSKIDDDLLQLLYQPRKVTPLAQLASSNHSVDYGQVDIIGIIITVLSSNITTANGKEKLVDRVYITDEHDNIIVVKVWDGVESMITKDCVSAGRVVCFINLSYKSWLDDDGIPTCSTNDQSIVTVKPQYVYLKPAFRNLEKFIKSNLTVLKNLEERIAHLH